MDIDVKMRCLGSRGGACAAPALATSQVSARGERLSGHPLSLVIFLRVFSGWPDNVFGEPPAESDFRVNLLDHTAPAIASSWITARVCSLARYSRPFLTWM